MANPPKNTSALTDSTNISANGVRTEKTGTNGTGKPVRAASNGGSGASKRLEAAIPGAKPAAPLKKQPPPKTKATARGNGVGPAIQEGPTSGIDGDGTEGSETMESLRAHLARAEAALAAQDKVTTPARAAVSGAHGNVPPPKTSTKQGTARSEPAPPHTPAAKGAGDTAQPDVQAPKPLNTIPKPRGGTSIQVGMRLAKTETGHLLYATARSTVRDCVTCAGMDLAVPWDKQPLEKRSLVVNAVKEKVTYMERMENDWATQMLARQYLKNKRVKAYAKGTLERPEGFDHLRVNATMRSADGSRIKKAKIILQEYQAKRALEDRDDGPPEFVQGSSPNVHEEFVVNEWDAHPEKDTEYHPEEDDDGARHEMEEDSQANESDSQDGGN
ncbi:hypothetical protein C8R45DRAFT_1114088 [Mycena sanguinolenta]|nr:hypothetical protein C8R45DRAFT_1114088 [Mycena sanguinolenta]